jgi:hypothetical protein
MLKPRPMNGRWKQLRAEAAAKVAPVVTAEIKHNAEPVLGNAALVESADKLEATIKTVAAKETLWQKLKA